MQIGPSVIEIVGGKDDGDIGFDFVDVDLLALPKCLDEVECFVYDPDYGRESHLTLAGKKDKREIVIEIYFEPFEDDEPNTIFDVNAGGWRGSGRTRIDGLLHMLHQAQACLLRPPTQDGLLRL